MKRIIILGASGQIGSLLHDGLLGAFEIVGTSRRPSQQHLQFDPFKDPWSLLPSSSAIINCIGAIQAPTHGFEHIHVELSKRMIVHRRELGHPVFIQISALGASETHAVEFMRTKGKADALLLDQPDTFVVRPSIVCTHDTMLVRKLKMLWSIGRLALNNIIVPKGFLQTLVQPVMPNDLVDIVKRICLRPATRVVAAVGPDRISFHQLLNMMMECRGRDMRVREIPRSVSDVLVAKVLSKFPQVIHDQQYQLLFDNNIGDANLVAQMLERPLTSPIPFFQKELGNDNAATNDHHTRTNRTML